MKTFSSKIGLALVALLAATGCSDATATPEDLAQTVVGFLASNDFDGYLAATVLSADQFFEVCPKGEKYTLDVADFRDGFDDCRKAFDFTNAEITSVSQTIETLGVGTKECGNTAPLDTADSIKVTVKAGTKSFTFRLDDAVETPNGWRQSDDLNCDVEVAGSGGNGGGI